LTSARPFIFGSRTNVFLLGKAETTLETRQVFHAALQLRKFCIDAAIGTNAGTALSVLPLS
jgi:hypothetical protein